MSILLVLLVGYCIGISGVSREQKLWDSLGVQNMQKARGIEIPQDIKQRNSEKPDNGERDHHAIYWAGV
jgi:hypothetical protein